MLLQHISQIATNTALTVYGRERSLAPQAEVIVTIAIMLGGVERKKRLITTSSDAAYERYAEIAHKALTHCVEAHINRKDLTKLALQLMGRCKLILDEIEDDGIKDDFFVIIKRLHGLFQSYDRVDNKNLFVVQLTTLAAILEDIKNDNVIFQ